jgi:hypothetical protein
MNAFTSSLTGVADHLAPQLLVWSLQAIVLVALALLLLRILEANSAALRHNILLLALLSIAALPLISLAPIPAPQQRLQAIARSYVAGLPTADLAPIPAKQQHLGAGPDLITAIKTIAYQASPYALRLAFCAWLLGVALLFTRLVLSEVALFVAYRNARPYESAVPHSLLATEVPVLLSERVASPLLYGVIRP